MANIPKHEIIREALLEALQSGKYGLDEKLPSENELCAQYSTSRITVRKAIDDLVIRGYLYRMQGVGTFVKRLSVEPQHQEQKILLILPDYIELSSTKIASDVVRGINQILCKTNYHLISMIVPDDENETASFVSHVQSEAPVGIIYGFYHERKRTFVERLSEIGVPIVFLDTMPEHYQGDCVIGEDYESAYRAVCLAYSQGLKKVGFVSTWDRSLETMHLRCEGIRGALEALETEFREEWFYFEKNDNLTFSSMQLTKEAKERLREYLERCPELEVVVAGNDIMAVVLYRAARELKREIPDSLKVISYGNYDWNNFYDLGFTSYEQNFVQYGKEAARLILERVKGKNSLTSVKKVIRYKLIRRESF